MKIIRSKSAPIFLFVVVFGALGAFLIINSFAASAPSVYLNPATSTIGVSTDFNVEIRENSGTTAVNAIQTNLTFNSTLLDVVSIDTSTTAFGVVAENTIGPGTINLGMGVSGGAAAKTGDQLVAIIHFKSKTTAGTANVNFTTGTALINSTTNSDLLGTLNSTTAPGGAYTVFVDTAPTAAVTFPTSGAKVKGTVTVTGTATDAQGVASVQFKLDGANLGAADTTSPYSVSWNSTTVADGSHTITATATDTGNQTTTSTGITFTVDNTPPDTTITSTNPGSTTSTSQSFTFTGSETGSTFECSLDSATFATCTSPKAYTGLAVGSHTFNVRAIDPTGNVDATPATQTWTITPPPDTTAPTVSITAPTNGSSVQGSNVAITATAADNVGVAGVSFYLDQTPPNGQLGAEDTASPYSATWNTTTLVNGSHTLTAVARDAAGNKTTSAVVTVTVNNPATPDVTKPSVPANLRSTSTDKSSVSLAWDASSDPSGANNETISGVKNYTVYRSTTSTGTYAALPGGTTTAQTLVDGSLTPSTTYWYKILATDNAGNPSALSASISATTAAAPALIPGDVDGNGVVDLLDLSGLLAHWNQSYPAADFKNSGTSAGRIDIYDLSILLSNYGRVS